jgi:GT2 family glycosyltransferase
MSSGSKFTFVILHYISEIETCACINSIISRCVNTDYEIVVVDNHSPNNSGAHIKEKYKNNKRVTIISNSSNLGFAKGNNVGISYAIEHFMPDFIIVLNNDVELIQSNFVSLIEYEYKRSHFSVLGPQIINLDGTIDSYSFIPVKASTLMKQMATNYTKILLIYLGVYMKYLNIKRRSNLEPANTNINKMHRHVGVVLQGSALIFSKKYFEVYKQGFDPRTFMYKEEQLLYLRLKSKNLTSVYSPVLRVLHKVEVSTKLATVSEDRKLLFLYINQLRSSFVLLPVLIKMKIRGY